MMAETVQNFSNVRRTRFWQRGFLASQTAYVGLALIVLIVVMSFASPNFLSAGNISNITRNFSFIAIATLGITLVIITGGIDLSVGSTMALTATTTSLTMVTLNNAGFYPFPGSALIISLLAGLATAGIIGFANGFAIAKLKLSPFVTTLGTLSIVRGLTYVATFGRGTAPAGPDKELFLALTSGKLAGMPISFVYLIIAAFAMWVALNHTAWGRHVYAIGGNEAAGKLTGVAVDRVKIQVYVICALAAGFNGIIISGWLGSAPANLATAYELTIIAAAVIGGANLAGGIGGASGAIIGCILIEVIRNGLVLARVDPYWQQTLVGCIIVAAVLVDRFRSLRSG
ncbi:ribose transport system permease protein [Kaistia hirudinis]|uniref:Ribose transport system permease protein n=1 Tax=Kaistia hirudinis TaxID=1293440 RepID=A0A840ASK5_9HYPH|nr:ABC transporter permease [Kaistia hirudinis]MBB3931346.1 ribose transport system permease protein [Kaistia hirudinis]